MQGPYTMRQRLEAARVEERIMLGGHRGNPAEHPENTLASFQSAIDAGCDLVECDGHLTVDGELAGTQHPRLAGVSELARDRVGLVIETKQNPIPYPGLEEKLVAMLREHDMVERVTVI